MAEVAVQQSVLTDISNNLRQFNRTNVDFKNAANQNNKSLGSVVRDISKMFTTQNKSQSGLNQSIRELESTSNDNGVKIDNTNSLISQSIGVQNQILNEIKSLNQSLSSFIGSGGNSGGGSSSNPLSALGLGFSLMAANQLAQSAAGGGNNGATAASYSNGPGAGTTENATYAMDYFKSQGLSDIAAAGIVGNFQQESYKNLNPGITNPSDNGTASYGIAQWNGERYDALKKFAESRQSSWDNIDTQLEFVMQELTTNQRFAGLIAKMNAAKSAGEAAEIWRSVYEVGSNPQARINNATTLYEDAMKAKQGAGATADAQSQTIQPQGWSNLIPKQETQKDDPADVKADGTQVAASPATNSSYIGFLSSRGGGGQGYAGVNAEKLNPAFAEKLMKGIQAAEQATGSKITITEGYRSPEVQAQYYSDYIGKPVVYGGKTYQPDPSKYGRLAAPPGRSKHQTGNAVDIADSPAREWLRQHAAEFGINQLGAKDPPHFQLGGASSGTAENYQVLGGYGEMGGYQTGAGAAGIAGEAGVAGSGSENLAFNPVLMQLAGLLGGQMPVQTPGTAAPSLGQVVNDNAVETQSQPPQQQAAMTPMTAELQQLMPAPIPPRTDDYGAGPQSPHAETNVYQNWGIRLFGLEHPYIGQPGPVLSR